MNEATYLVNGSIITWSEANKIAVNAEKSGQECPEMQLVDVAQ